jgi:DNA (cytosine-5)-methyltransferase 1
MTSSGASVISLFAGGGGSSTGYKMAGCRVLAASEFIASARTTYVANHPDTVLYGEDIRDLSPDRVLADVGIAVGELDILDGSPPCASFSSCGKREKLWGKVKAYSDTKQRTDDLFLEYARFVRHMQPRVFVAENVRGLTIGAAADVLGSAQTSLFGEHKETFFHILRECGYRVACKVLNAADYGVPQTRQRLFIIGVRNDLGVSPSYPTATCRKHVTLGESFSTVVNTADELAEVDIRRYEIYKVLEGMPSDTSRIVYSTESELSKFFQLRRMSPSFPSHTLTQSAGMLSAASIVHWDHRKFTVPECKAIMSFPPEYKLTGEYREQVERLGRAVPPLMTKAVAEHVMKTILKEPAK